MPAVRLVATGPQRSGRVPGGEWVTEKVSGSDIGIGWIPRRDLAGAVESLALSLSRPSVAAPSAF